MKDHAKLLEKIRNSIIGLHHELAGPFGQHLVTYADYTASGRSLTFIEDFIREHVLPYYANTHTESSGTGLQSTRFREDAREIISQAVAANENDVLIFTGSGATGAINKLIDIMNLRLPSNLDDQYGLQNHIPAEQRPVVFIGPYEHHSNELPWRESIADVVVIDEDENGLPDRELLKRELRRFSSRPLKIGSFSVASNVTGIGSGARELSIILHQHDALAFWDFAAAAPYAKIEMNFDSSDPNDYKDAVFISPHKFIGGPGTPGILIVKRKLVTNRVPTVPGGGTVAYVGPTEHRYLEDLTHREEGGTPDIIGAIRAGLVFQLKEAVGIDFIRRQEDTFVREAIDRWRKNANLQILGNPDVPRLSIVSFMVRFGDRYLHHNFVVTLLNDLFGIQARGGCSCAGPYGHRLLGISREKSLEYQQEILRGCEGIKPGWTRLSFNYFITPAAFNFLIEAVEFIATNGWKFLPYYTFSPSTGLWDHRNWQHRAQMRLQDIHYHQGNLEFPHEHQRANESAFVKYLEDARQLADAPISELKQADHEMDYVNDEFDALRWFPLPHEIHADR